ncbi:leucine-rich repeat-containing protein 15-like [Diabrotica virgifera virgifera]|uniref:Uncharacterized protein n=1 Tax=Diabrotica virgifera virgifera TaxID=50390 RepID=A0ABM5KGG1_DIAVI|nr:leucine-rich repeat-containing protein 15-like [Diabrotica virgifera virgifera]
MKTLIFLVIIVSCISRSFQMTCDRTYAITICYQIHISKANPLLIDDYNSMLSISLDEQSDTIYTNAFIRLAELKRLILSNNKIKTLELGSFNGLSKLDLLSLYNNSLTTVDSSTFQNLHNLEILSLGSNQITSISNDGFLGLDKLEELKLSFNQLAEFPVQINTIKTLRKLDLNGNKIKSLKANSFSNLKKLEKLNLNDNLINSLEAKSFAGLSNLRELSLKSNYLKQFNTQDVLEDLGSLQRLNLAINDLKCADLKNIDNELQRKRITFEEGINKQNPSTFKGIKCNN